MIDTKLSSKALLVELKIGNPASLNIIDAPTVQEAFRTQADRFYVMRKGRIIARTETNSRLFRGRGSLANLANGRPGADHPDTGLLNTNKFSIQTGYIPMS